MSNFNLDADAGNVSREDLHLFDAEWEDEHRCPSCDGSGIEDEWALHPAPCLTCYGDGTL